MENIDVFILYICSMEVFLKYICSFLFLFLFNYTLNKHVMRRLLWFNFLNIFLQPRPIVDKFKLIKKYKIILKISIIKDL